MNTLNKWFGFSWLALVLVTVWVTPAMAVQDPVLDVKITSFRLITGQNQLAELCGKIIVQPSVTPEPIQAGLVSVEIISDFQTNAPAHYNTWSKIEGRFCQLIATYTGRAEVRIVGTSAVARTQ